MSVGSEAVAYWREHPDRFVRDVFKVEPDAWQDKVLRDFPSNPLQVMLACKGPGKTAVLAWLCWNFLATRAHPKIGAVSITGTNLEDGLWAEMAKWLRRSEALRDAFEWQKTRIFAKESPETWFMSFRTWPQSADPQQLGETLAGLWSDNVMIVMDEAGGIPVPVLRTAEVVVTQSAKPGCEGHVILAGNTTSIEGSLYEAAVTRRHMWTVYEITADPDDPNRTPRIPKEHAQAQIDEHGRDDPWVMINILAKFPKQGLNALISSDDVIAAQKRHMNEAGYSTFARIMGMDVARFGDDETVVWKRQGPVSFMPLRWRGLDHLQDAGHSANIFHEWNADSIQIDATGGYGGSVCTQLKDMGYANAIGVEAAGKAYDPKFYNKRAETAWKACQWIREGGILPPVPEMVRGLSTMTYSFKGDRLIIEDKQRIKARLGRSPDAEDAFFLTFAHPVAPRARANSTFDLASIVQSQNHQRGTSYNPIERYAEQLKR